MSAESYQKRAPSTSSDTVRLMPNIVPPQAVSDRSIIDSVAGFINDVALTNTPQTDPKDHILWVTFENLADISDSSLGEDWDVEGGLPPPLLLCIGYGSGVQVWAIPANGEAIEVMSWRNGVVKVLRILPTPFLSNNSELASDLLDQFIHKRPLMALCGDCPSVSQSLSPSQFHSANFVSLKDGDVVKSIRFKSPIVDIVANRTSIAITFAERIAVFDARTLEDRLTVTTCYPCPGGLCPIALGDRWLAYAEKKMIPSKTSAGGCFFEGVPSYTATVLNAAKTLGKGLRELGEQVAAGLTGSGTNMSGHHGAAAADVVNADGSQAGIVTILDIKHPIKDISPTTGTPVAINGNDPIVAHFLAHAEAVTAMSFDPSGMLLLTADRRGNDFNVFRIQPHPCGSAQAAVHHLYVLHRGDTSAKVQDISFSYDSRWVTVSSFRGTTHVFPITPYGGQPGYRTHSAPHVVNRLSRFHRSAGLNVDGRSCSPILMAEHAANSTAYANPRLPPFPHPTVVLPLAQLRQPSSLGSASSSLSALATGQMLQQGNRGASNSRQRLQSQGTEETHSKPLRVTAVFAKARSWLLDPPGLTHETPSRLHRKAVDSLFVIAGHGALIQYDLEPRHASSIAKDKVCDETPIELYVEPKAQWILGSRSNTHAELTPPLPPENWLIKDRVIDNNLNMEHGQIENAANYQRHDRWLSQVEIVTHAGPHRRLWMGPQFVFKTYNTPSGNSLACIDTESVEVGKATKSTPMNMPLQPNTSAIPRATMPVLIESGSYSSHEQSPRLMDSFQYENSDVDVAIKPDSQLREDLADAMKDCATISVNHDSGSSSYFPSPFPMSNEQRNSNMAYMDRQNFPSIMPNVVVSVVNPQGNVTTVTNNAIQQDESYTTEIFIHENFDETLFRPVVQVMGDPNQHAFPDYDLSAENASVVVDMPSELIVPVIDEAMLQQKRKDRDEEIKKSKNESVEAARKIQKHDSEPLNVDKVELETEKAAQVDVKSQATEKPQDPQLHQKRGKRGPRNKKYEDKKTTEKTKKGFELDKELARNVKEAFAEKTTTADGSFSKEPSVDKDFANRSKESSIERHDFGRKSTYDNVVQKKASGSSKEPSVEKVMPQEFSFGNATNEEQSFQTVAALDDTNIAVLNEAISEMKLGSEIAESTTELPFVVDDDYGSLKTSKRGQEQQTFPKVSPDEVSCKKEKVKYPKADEKKTEPFVKKGKKGEKSDNGAKHDSAETEGDDDFPPLIAQNQSELMAIETTPFEEIREPLFGDDVIEITPHDVAEDDVHSDSDANLIDESLIQSQDFSRDGQQEFIKNEDFYDIDEDLPPLEPLEQFEPFNTPLKSKSLSESVCQKQEMKQKMSELLKDTNIVFAMCSSLKEIKDDGDVMSSSSQIQRSTSSSLTTNTTTATFASANSNASLEGQDIDDSSPVEQFAASDLTTLSNIKPSVEEGEETSGFETTSSETDESSKKSNVIESSYKREHDEELRPLLESSITSLSASSSAAMNATEAINIPTLPETNQKLPQTQPASNNSGSKRKNKKKRSPSNSSIISVENSSKSKDSVDGVDARSEPLQACKLDGIDTLINFENEELSSSSFSSSYSGDLLHFQNASEDLM